jgi:phosphopantetheinyl transferase
MSRDSSKWIKEHFASSSRDLTPTVCGQDVRVLYAPVSYDPGVTRHCVSILSASEMQRADRFIARRDQIQFKQRRAFRRFCGALALDSSQPLSEIVFCETDNGRPYMSDSPDFWFSFSSCGFGFIGAWSSSHGIGIDVEDRTRNLDATQLAQQFFTPAEAKAIEYPGGTASLRTFFKFWSLKEAALKSIGEGIPFGLDAFEFELDPLPSIVRAPLGHGGPAQFKAHMVDGIDHCAALVTRTMLR